MSANIAEAERVRSDFAERVRRRVEAGDWIDHGSLVGAGLEVVDGCGQRIDRVRSARELAGGGIEVRIIHTVNDGHLTVCEDPAKNIAEFGAFIRCGEIRERRDDGGR